MTENTMLRENLSLATLHMISGQYNTSKAPRICAKIIEHRISSKDIYKPPFTAVYNDSNPSASTQVIIDHSIPTVQLGDLGLFNYAWVRELA